MTGPVTSSDVGRRLRQRREALGQSVETVASRAGIDPGYLEYLETSAVSNPTRGTILRLALALHTSAPALLGGTRQVPPGHGVDQPPAKLVELDHDHCMELIGPGGVGRAVFVDARGPVALPVNYAVVDGDIVFRTEPSTSIASGSHEHRISFEVDHVDDAFEEGWSVLVSGPARAVSDPGNGGGSFPIRPWVEGDRAAYFRLTPEIVTGRQLERE